MATIATHLKLMDQFYGPLGKAIQQTNSAIASMERLRKVVEKPTKADIAVELDTSQAIKEAQQASRDVSKRLDNITAQVELDVSTQVSKAVGNLNGPLDQIHREIERLADTLQSFNEAPRGATSAVGGFGGAGKFMGLAAGAAGILGGAALLKGSAEQQQIKGSLQAQVGVDEAQAAAMLEGVNDVFSAGWGESLAGVSEDMATVRQNLRGLSQDAATAFTQSAYAVEKVAKGQTDVNELSKVTRTLLANFDNLGETQALDLITTGFQRGGNYAGDLMDTINEYSVHFAGLGMSAEQMFATLIAGSEEGAWNLDKVGDAVKESFIRMQDLSKTSSEAFQGLGFDPNKMAANIAAGGESANQAYQATLLALSNMENATDRNTVGVKLFGTQWEDLEDSVVLAMQAGKDGLGEFEGATARASEALQNNFGFQLEQLKRNFSVGFAESGQSALTALSPLIAKLSEAFKSGKLQPFFASLEKGLTIVSQLIGEVVDNALWLSGVISDNWPSIEPVVWGIVAAFTTWKAITLAQAIQQGVLAFATGTSTLAIFAQTLATQGLAAAWRGLNTAMKANIFILIVSLIVGLIVWIVKLWQTNDTFAAALMRTWNAILNFFDQIPIFFQWVGNGIADALDWAKVQSLQIVEDLANGVVDQVNWLIDQLNKIPGVSLDTFDHINITASAAAEAEAAKQARAAKLEGMKENAAQKAAEREEQVKKFLADRQADRARKEAEKEANKNKGQGNLSGSGGGKNKYVPSKATDPRMPTMGGDIGKVGKVGQVDKINGTVDISSEDLKMMRELAEMKNIQNFVTLQPSISFGDTHVRQQSDINTIIAHISEKLEQDIASSVDAVYG